MLNVGADWGEICLYVNISFLLIRELDLFIVQVNEIISVIPVNVNTTYVYVRYISTCIGQVCDGKTLYLLGALPDYRGVQLSIFQFNSIIN